MPPMRISDVPISDPSKDRNFRSYKLQFQAPQQVGLYTWKLQIVSDTFLGDEIVRDMTVSCLVVCFFFLYVLKPDCDLL